jgi:hypothetical protein
MATTRKLVNNVSGVLEILGGSGAVLTVEFDRGNVSADSLKAILNATNKISRRGRKKGVTVGERLWPKVSFELDVDQAIGNDAADDPGSVLELIHGKGTYGPDGASPQSSFEGAGHEIYTCGLRLTVTPDKLGTPPEIYEWHSCDATAAFSEDGEVNSLKIDGEVLGEPALTITNGENVVTYGEFDPDA